jgi:hypothetical protein
MKNIVVEPFSFNVAIFEDKEECISWVKEHHPTDQETLDKLKNCEGLTMQFESNPVFAIYLKDMESLDHEIVHLTWYILEYSEVNIDSNNHEIQAYLFDYIKRLILN